MTMLWMLPAMAAMGLGGFFLVRYVLPSSTLKESKIQRDKLHPVRILNPEESSKLSGDNTSHVWTDGVQKSDLPKEEPSSIPRRKRPASKPQIAPSATDTLPDTPIESPTDNGGYAPNPDDSSPPPNYNGTNE